MGMEALGRTINIVPIAAGVGLSCAGGSGWTFVCTGNDTFTITTSATFGGSYTAPGNVIVRKYTSSATNGTVGWTGPTAVGAANTGATGGGTTVFYVDNNSLLDTHKYIKCSVGGSGLVTAIQGDLVHQRRPSNLPILSA